MPQVRVEIVFSDIDGVSAGEVIGVMDDIKGIAHDAERTVLATAVCEARLQDPLTQVEADAIQLRFDRLRGASLLERSIHASSFELTLWEGAAALLTLRKAVGDTSERSNAGSSLDQLVMGFFRKSVDGMVTALQSALKRQVRENDRLTIATRWASLACQKEPEDKRVCQADRYRERRRWGRPGACIDDL